MANTDYEQMARDLISNISYTNKDFRSIYPELIDLVKKLTNKWDPEITNESDPGLILLKLNAIIADKNNYNIDKNILEAFPLSVTQYGNARKIYDILGYKMKWYQSATTTLSMVDNSGKVARASSFSTGDRSGKNIFDIFTMFSNDAGDVIYTLTRNVSKSELSTKGQAITDIPVIEGANYEYEINGETLITLNNLDADLRLYFREPYVAENGIFIKRDGDSWDSAWTKVDNLASEILDQTIFEFGVLPNSDTCYVQFPQDIGNLIGSGLRIRYVISSGVKGNVSAKEINTCTVDIIAKSSDDTEINLNDSIIIQNPSSTTSGKDPETLDEAYKNYKKTIGTFNTLVTCRDYENNIYNAKNGTNNYVSNIVVSDRTNDLQSVYTTIDDENISKKKFITATYGDPNKGLQTFTAYNLALAPLSPVTNISSIADFNDTFTLKRATRNLVVEKLESSENLSCIQHDYIDNTDNPVVIFKNKFTVNAKILTYYKLSNEEIKDLKNKIQQALMLKYNSRQVEFGESVDYDTLVKTIENSDSRIRTAIVDIPSYTTYIGRYIDPQGINISDNLKLNDYSTITTDIKTNMVMRGNTQLIDFNDNFEWQIGQTNSVQYSNIQQITSEITIPVSDLGRGYTLKENENIQAISPSYVAIQTVKDFVTCTISNTIDSGEVTFADGVVYPFDNSDQWKIKVVFKYTKDGKQVTTEPPSTAKYFRISGTDITLSGTAEQQIDLGSNKRFESLRENTTDIDSTNNCYWILNNTDNILFAENIHEKVLDTNEYFIYTDAIKSGIVILGSGTKLTRASNSNQEIKVSKNISAEQISENGISSIPDSAFYHFTSDDKVVLHEMIIYTFGPNTRVWTEVTNNVDNNLQDCKNLKYQNPNENEQELKGNQWQIRSRLNLNATPSNPQILVDNQTIIIGNEAITNKSVLFSQNVQLAGGADLDMSVLDLEGNVGYTLNALAFTPSKIDSFTLPYIKNGGEVKEFTYPITLLGGTINPEKSGSRAIIKLSVNDITSNTDADKVIVSIPDSVTGSVANFNSTENLSTTATAVTITTVGTNYIQLKAEDSTSSGSGANLTGFKVKCYGNAKVTVDNILYVFADNVSLDTDNVRKKIAAKLAGHQIDAKPATFDYTYIVPEEVQVDDPLKPDSFWSSNHYCNRFTIAQLDLAGSNIMIL